MKRKKITASEPMSEETKALLAENRKAKAEADAEERVARMHETKFTWRRNELRRYVAKVLSTSGRDRLDFFESNPIGGMFR